MPLAAIFDFDGTIADTIAAIREGVNLTMRKNGFPEHSHEAVQSFVNNGARQLIRLSLPAQLREDEATVDRVLADYDALYATVFRLTDRAYDGMPELIAELHTRGWRIGVLSNKQDVFVKALSEQVLLPGTFDAAQGVIAGQPTKPHPYFPQRIADALGVALSDCVMIGDSDVDLKTARNAGMRHVGVSWGYRSRDFLLQIGAQSVADTPGELRQMLLDMEA